VRLGKRRGRRLRLRRFARSGSARPVRSRTGSCRSGPEPNTWFLRPAPGVHRVRGRASEVVGSRAGGWEPEEPAARRRPGRPGPRRRVPSRAGGPRPQRLGAGRARLRPSRPRDRGRSPIAQGRPAEPRQAGRRVPGRLGRSLALPAASHPERARSGAGANLKKNFCRCFPPYALFMSTLTPGHDAVSPAGTVTCRGTMAYKGGGEEFSAGLGEPVFSYDRRRRRTQYADRLHGRPVAARRSLTIRIPADAGPAHSLSRRERALRRAAGEVERVRGTRTVRRPRCGDVAHSMAPHPPRLLLRTAVGRRPLPRGEGESQRGERAGARGRSGSRARP